MNIVIISGEEFFVSTTFQPVYLLSSQKIYKYESLGRLENIAGDGVAATDIAESTANQTVIRQVTEIIFNLTCSLLIRKNELRASFHFPKSLLADEEFLAKMHSRCEILSIAPAQIEIELSKEISTAQLVDNLDFLLLARRYGFKIALDTINMEEFPLEALSSFDFDTVKIDKELINETGKCHSLIECCRRSGAEIICEGRNQEFNLAKLREYNNIGFQGYVYSRPLSMNQVRLLEGV